MKMTTPRSELRLHSNSHINWSFNNIPKSIQAQPFWKLCYIFGSTVNNSPIITSKRPINGPQPPFSSFTRLVKMINEDEDQHFGYVFTKEDPFIGIDVDDLPVDFVFADLPKTIQALLQKHPTYSEISPSGQGLHIIYELTDKDTLLTHRKAADKGVDGFTGAIYLYDQFLTFTGHTLAPARGQESCKSSDIATIPAADLPFAADLPATTAATATSMDLSPFTSLADLPKAEDIIKWLLMVPPTLTGHPFETTLRHIYTTFTPPLTSVSDYDHWQTVIAATRDGFYRLNAEGAGEDAVIAWSQADQYGTPASERDIRNKYRANPATGEITYKTLRRLAACSQPAWEEFMWSKGEITSFPDCGHVQNWKIAMDHLGIDLVQNVISKDVEYRGNTVVRDQCELTKPITCLTDLATDLSAFKGRYYFKHSTPQHLSSAAKYLSRHVGQVNPFIEWLESTPYTAKDAQTDWFDILWSTLHLQEHNNEERVALYKVYLKKSLMGLIRGAYYKGPFSATTGIVILQGPEASWKSTWVRNLLPKDLRQYVYSSQIDTSRASIKEWQLEAATCLIWLKDEVETCINDHGSTVKAMLDQNDDCYRPLYGGKPVLAPRRCIFFGTTNHTELQISDAGSRRIMIIPVTKCDTNAQADIPLLKVYQQLKAEFETTADDQKPKLWTLLASEIAITDVVNSTERSKATDLTLALDEIFDYAAEFDINTYRKPGNKINVPETQLYTLSQIIQILQFHNYANVRLSVLKHALARKFYQWSTLRKPVMIGQVELSPDGALRRYKTTASKNGKPKMSWQMWLMPPLRTAADLSFGDEAPRELLQ